MDPVIAMIPAIYDRIPGGCPVTRGFPWFCRGLPRQSLSRTGAGRWVVATGQPEREHRPPTVASRRTSADAGAGVFVVPLRQSHTTIAITVRCAHLAPNDQQTCATHAIGPWAAGGQQQNPLDPTRCYFFETIPVTYNRVPRGIRTRPDRPCSALRIVAKLLGPWPLEATPCNRTFWLRRRSLQDRRRNLQDHRPLML